MTRHESIQEKIHKKELLSESDRFFVVNEYFENVNGNDKEKCNDLYKLIKECFYDPVLIKANSFYHHPGFGGI